MNEQVANFTFMFCIFSNTGNLINAIRKFSWIALLVFMLGCQPQVGSLTPTSSIQGKHITILGQVEYIVHQQLKLVNTGPGKPDKQNIWVALIRDFPPYQSLSSMEVSPKDYALVIDEFGNHYAEFDFSNQPSGTTETINIDYRVTVNELVYDLADCEGKLPDDFTQPELHIESANPQIVALASKLSQGKKGVCQQVRAFYDYIGDNLVYTYNGENWGAQAALGPMGADCTEYTALLMALSRAKSIPARYFTGLLYMDTYSDTIANIAHAWPDVYMPATGWVPLDPTLGRTTVKRDIYFAHYTPDHIIVTLGANPSVLRGSSYWTHLYWPGNSTNIQASGEWKIDLVNHGGN
jgi:transglutaminase-like putative cysteine protease